MARLTVWGPLAPLGLALAGLVYGVDQTHKWWMLDVFGIAERQPVTLAPFFELVLVWNRGVSYGLLTTHLQEALAALSIAVSFALWIWLCRSGRPLTAAAIAIVIGGALGNATDRVFRGAVADFFHFHVGSFSWYVFNIADVAIVAGVLLLLYEGFRDKAPA